MFDSKQLSRFSLLIALAVAIVGFAPVAHAQANSTRAARLIFAQGAVNANQPNGGDSVPAQLNLPLFSGVQLATGNDGQAEVEFEDGSIVRLTPNSTLSLDNLAIDSDGSFVTNLSLLHGLAYCELRATTQYRYSISAAGDILSPLENTTVRINFDQPPAIFSVLDGTAQIERQSAPANGTPNTGYQTQVRAGESLSADGNDANRYFLTQQISPDSWDQWNEDRDQAAASQASDTTPVRNNYAGAEGYGWSDLDANGNWYSVPGQGQVWQPQIAAEDPGFDPYGNGAWVYYPSSGYVWASGYAWGWTPYRCGNWSYYGGFGWGWAPGAGCGGRGWGFAGGGRTVNITIGPTGYRPLRVPGAGNPHLHPILPVVTTKSWAATRPPHENQGPRQIAGLTVQPIARQHEAPLPGGGGGWALRRDFPIDARSKAPVLGLASTNPAATRRDGGQRAPDQRPGSSQNPSIQTPGQPEVYGGRRYPSNLPPASSGASQTRPATQVQDNRPATQVQDNHRPAVIPAPTQPTNPRYPGYSRPSQSTAPGQPAPGQTPSYRRPADNNPPSQSPQNQMAAPRAPQQQTAPAPPSPPARPAPPAERSTERSAPPAVFRAPPSPPPPPSRPNSPPPPPQPPAASRSAPSNHSAPN